jgi:hypothetical protein
MCRRVECDKCKKPTFAGCGAHIEQVLGDVPREDRCSCREKAKEQSASGDKPPGEPGFFRRILGG